MPENVASIRHDLVRLTIMPDRYKFGPSSYNTCVTRRPLARRYGRAGWSYSRVLLDRKSGMRKGTYTSKTLTDARLCDF
jgi:hypothetical protein